MSDESDTEEEAQLVLPTLATPAKRQRTAQRAHSQEQRCGGATAGCNNTSRASNSSSSEDGSDSDSGGFAPAEDLLLLVREHLATRGCGKVLYEQHLARDGETPAGVARCYGMLPAQVVKDNYRRLPGLRAGSKLRAGTMVLVRMAQGPCDPRSLGGRGVLGGGWRVLGNPYVGLPVAPHGEVGVITAWRKERKEFVFRTR